MKMYLDQKLVSQGDIEETWKLAECEVKVKQLALEKEMIASFNEKELSYYLQRKNEAQEKGVLDNFRNEELALWEKLQHERNRKSISARTRGIVESKQQGISEKFEAKKEIPSAESTANTRETQDAKQLASAPAPVQIQKDTPVVIPFIKSEGSGGGGGTDYRVDDSTSERTKDILESINVDSCFSGYIRPGSILNSVSEVRKWQHFLNDYLGTDLNITGVYDAQTQAGVRAFQEQYAQYVLEPWELDEPTSYIYKTTRSMANYIIGCPEGELFLDDLGVNYSHLEQGIKLR